MLKKIKSLLIPMLLLYIISFPLSSFASNNVPVEAKEYADENFHLIIKSLYDGADDPTLYNFDEEMGTITFGELIPLNIFLSTIIESDNIERNNFYSVADEWFTVVYQNDQPKNIIGVYKDDSGQYSFSQMGFNVELVEALHQFPSESILIYSGPMDEYYQYNLDKETVLSINSGITYQGLSNFQRDFVQQYDSMIRQSNDMDGSAGLFTTTTNQEQVINHQMQ